VIVVDASAALAALLNDDAARRALSGEQLHAPHLVDTDVVSALRRRVAREQLSRTHAQGALAVWQRLWVTRYAGADVLSRVWELRQNVSAYDATYVALAESLECALVTADGRLGRATGVRCVVTVLPG